LAALFRVRQEEFSGIPPARLSNMFAVSLPSVGRVKGYPESEHIFAVKSDSRRL